MRHLLKTISLGILLSAVAATGALPVESFDRPHGIYALDSAQGTMTNGVSMRDANIRSNSFVNGYMLRASWEALEPAQGQYDFTIIDWNLRKVQQLGLRLSLQVVIPEPAYIAAAPGALKWFDADPRINAYRPAPWDSFALERLQGLLQALANHEVDGVKLKYHPTLSIVNFGIAGAHLAIRDPAPPSNQLIKDMPGYSRTNFLNAVLTNLYAATANFPNKFVQVGFWQVQDDNVSQPLWQDIRARMMDEFDGVKHPHIGLWVENLAASRPAPATDPVTGYPNTSFAQTLYLSQTNSWTSFQALTSWKAPFTGASNVTNGTPADGIGYAFTNFGSTYFEIYVNDIDEPSYQAGFKEWSSKLTPFLVRLQTQSNDFHLSWPSQPGENFGVEYRTNLQPSSAWQLLSTNFPAGAVAETEFIHSNALLFPSGFYRVARTTNIPLPVFAFDWSGTNFTYTDAARTFTGILLKPDGSGPFPAVIINHGAGGSVTNYSLQKAREMSPWGLVCLAPNLTHVSGGETNPANMGFCAENLERIRSCLNVLPTLGYVDTNRIALFGHSMGAFASIGSAGVLVTNFLAAAITGGGVIPDSAGTNNSAPTVTEANPVRTPFLMIHCDADPVVPPVRSQLFQQVLNSNSVPNQRILISSNSIPNTNNWHNIQNDSNANALVLTNTRAWFRTYGVLP
jgi:dienelactone hydrolase